MHTHDMHRHPYTQTHKQRHIHIETYRLTQRQRSTQLDIEYTEHSNIQTYRHTHIHTQTYKHTD